MSAGTFSPRPGTAPVARMLVVQVAFETRLLLRNGEQLLLAVIIPVALLALLATVPVVDTGPGRAVDILVPGVLALVVMSTAFTSLAISTGYERRYGVLRRMAVSPLPRWGVLAAKAGTVLVVEAVQVALVCTLGLVLGWRPVGLAGPVVTLLWVAVLLLAGTAAFAGVALALAGTLRAEATLAAANLVYLVLLVLGGVVVPLDRFPESLRPFLEATPTGALTQGLRAVLTDGGPAPVSELVVLLVWTVVGFVLATRLFRWE